MESRTLTRIFAIVAVFIPLMVSGQSRGEQYRGDPSSTSSIRGFVARVLPAKQSPYPEYYQSQSQVQSYNPNKQPGGYSQSQSSFIQSYNTPAYVSQAPQPPYQQHDPYAYPQNNQNYNPDPNPPNAYPQQTNPYPPQNVNNYAPQPQNTYQNAYPSQPSYSQPAPLPPPPFQPQNKVQTQPQHSIIDNRFSDESSTQVPPYDTNSDVFMTRPTKAAKRPRPTMKTPPRFDNRDDPIFKKTLAYDEELSNSMEQFSLLLMHTTNEGLEQENFMISPFSIYHLLVLIAEGAKGNTLTELSDQLKMMTLERTRDFQQYLNVAINRNTADVILNKFAMMVTDRARPVNPEFETRIEKIYEADVMPVFFSDVDNTLNSINRAVSNYTQGQITDTVKREDLFKAQLILISGLFFQGKWMNVFNTTFTKQEPFFDNNGLKTGDVNMMFQRGLFAYAGVADLGCHIIELPYAELPASRNGVTGTGLSMILVLPRKGLSLDEAIANIYKHGMKKIYVELYNSKVEYEDEEVEVHVPRFEIDTSLNMKPILESMGIKDMFDQSRADLSNINKQYFVSSMIHKTKMSVDERGTTAAAVTTSIFANKATPPKFHANKPFLFFIVDRVTNLILFSGQYVKPELY